MRACRSGARCEVEVADKPLAEVEADLVAVWLFEGEELPPSRSRARPGPRTSRAAFKKADAGAPRAPRGARSSSASATRDEFDAERARVAAALAAQTAGLHGRLDRLAAAGTRRRRPRRPRPPGRGHDPRLLPLRPLQEQGDDEDERPKGLEELTLIGDGGLAEAVEAARVGAEAENRARELQNLPSNVVTPSYLAGRARGDRRGARLGHRRGARPRGDRRRRAWAGWSPSPRAPPRSRS